MCQLIEVMWFIWKLSAEQLIVLLDRDQCSISFFLASLGALLIMHTYWTSMLLSGGGRGWWTRQSLLWGSRGGWAWPSWRHKKFIPGTYNGFITRLCFVVSRGKSRDVAIKRPKVCVYLLMLYSKIAIYSRKEHFRRKKSRTSRDRRDDTTDTGASLETHN